MENTHVKAKTNQKFGIQFKVTVDSCNATEVLQVEVQTLLQENFK